MKSTKMLTKGLLALSLITQHFVWTNTAQASQTERPPQFVLLAFDGSYTNQVWQHSRDFSQEQKMKGVDTRFTFFINPVYLVTRKNMSVYKAPGKVRGSAIGWADDNNDILERVDQMNEAFLEGHEIANHAVGHWDGSSWTESQWDSELKQFNYILDNVFSINGLGKTKQGSSSLKFDYRRDVVGFRAPLLGYSAGMWPALKKNGITYDTSKKSAENYWPEKQNGIWNFPLGLIKEPAGSRTWVSMDYNFCVRDSAATITANPNVMSYKAMDPITKKMQSNGAKDCLRVVPPEQKAKVKANMTKLYKSYFEKNYYGNRAPVHIGHHFSQWMSGAYYEVFFEFAKKVCSQPEVKCVTYKELHDYMEGLTPSQVKDLRAGNFTKMVRPKSSSEGRHLDIKVGLAKTDKDFTVALTGADSAQRGLVKTMVANGKSLDFDQKVSLADIRKMAQGSDIVRFSIKNRMGDEISSAVIEVKDLGKTTEVIGTENLEDRTLEGHMDGAHSDEGDHAGHNH